jgi:hypothetical protein
MVTQIGTPAPTTQLIGFTPVTIQGTVPYLYTAYADDTLGNGFSLIDATKNCIAIKTSASPITNPQASDFTGLWFDRTAGSSALTNVRAGSYTITITGNSTIVFSSPLPSNNYELTIIDSLGLGIDVKSKTANGFTINCLNPTGGIIGYTAIMNI